MSVDLVETLSQLVSIPTVNPMGGAAFGPECGEGRLTDYLQSLFERLCVPWHRQPVSGDRHNIVARLDGSSPPAGGEHVLLFEAHQDTVPVAGMSIEPFMPVVRQRRLYGRGACDVKGGMAAILHTASRLAEERPRGMPTILLAFTVNEEYGFTGAKALAEWFSAGADGFIPRKPDAAIVVEPTELSVIVAHKGVVRWRCHTQGRACHSSQPDLGENAIYRMARVVQALELYHREVLALRGRHPLLRPGTLSVGMIRGGVSVNIVPDHTTIEVDRRLEPDEDPHEAWRDLAEYLDQRPEIDFPVRFDSPHMQAPALSDRENGPLADRLARAVREVTGDCRQTVEPYATDAPFFSSAGIPTVVFGPGSLAQAHTDDEWISLEQLELAAEVYYRVAKGP